MLRPPDRRYSGEQRNSCVELDIRLRNAGTESVNLTRLNLHILERYPALGAIPPSAAYDLVVDGEHNVIPISHGLQPGEIDRLIIRVGFTRFNMTCLFRAELVFYLNGDKAVSSAPFSFVSDWE